MRTLSPRPVFDPAGPYPIPPAAGGVTGWRAAPRAVLAFYRDPLSWFAVAVTSVMLCYVGGLVMFWFHAVELSEGGPAISWYAHWALDSTFAFLALTPALLLIVPLAVGWSGALAGAGRPAALLAAYAVIAGGLFALVTTPGPLAHDLVVGRGTWIAERVTAWIGDPSAPATSAAEYPVSAALSQQLGAGVALYVLLAAAAAVLVRAAVAAHARRGVGRGAGRGAGPPVAAGRM